MAGAQDRWGRDQALPGAARTGAKAGLWEDDTLSLRGTLVKESRWADVWFWSSGDGPRIERWMDLGARGTH